MTYRVPFQNRYAIILQMTLTFYFLPKSLDTIKSVVNHKPNLLSEWLRSNKVISKRNLSIKYYPGKSELNPSISQISASQYITPYFILILLTVVCFGALLEKAILIISLNCKKSALDLLIILTLIATLILCFLN